MTEPEKLQPPIVGKVTHSSIELSWDKDYTEETIQSDDGRRQYCVQEGEEEGPQGFGTVYNGFARSHLFRGLEPSTTYRYRVRVGNNHGYSPWSAVVSVATLKVPLTGADIHRAIVNWEVEKVKRILSECDDDIVDIPDVYGMSPIMIASQKGFTSLVEILIQHGANVNYSNASGKTSLMLSCFGGHLNVSVLLFDHGACLTAKDNGGSNALHWAVDGNKEHCIKWLLEQRILNVDEEDISGWSPLMRLATVNGSLEVARTLIEHGADVNRKDKTGVTPLMAASLNGNLEVCKLLVENGAKLYTKNEEVLNYLVEVLHKHDDTTPEEQS